MAELTNATIATAVRMAQPPLRGDLQTPAAPAATATMIQNRRSSRSSLAVLASLTMPPPISTGQGYLQSPGQLYSPQLKLTRTTSFNSAGIHGTSSSASRSLVASMWS